MPIISRQTLKDYFQGGVLPTTEQYASLIDSMLSRRDDQFFGVWQRGKRYCEGDVVLFDKSIYKLLLTDAAELCDDPAEENEKKSRCICSETEPSDDVNWCELQLEIDDHDWSVIYNEEREEPTHVYNLRAKIGVGLERAATRLEVKGTGGHFRVDPDGEVPAVSLVEPEEKDDERCRSAWRLKERTEFETDSLGFAFFHSPAAPPKLLFFLTTVEERPATGIGTDQPMGILHAEDEGHGKLIVNHRGGNEGATVLLVNTVAGGNGHYLLSGITDDFAYLQTDAHQGLRIIVGGDYAGLDRQMGEGLTAVAVDNQGHVGIGTESPRSKLEVTEADMGTVRLDFGNDNVCISTINERPTPQHPSTYHAMGVDDEQGVFITDTQGGFVFKAGRPCGEYDHEVDINQGDKVAFITPEGRMGLRTIGPPKEYDLHVNGHLLSQTIYQETDGSRINRTGTFEEVDVLKQIKKLHPIYFEWKTNTNAADANPQIGFNAQNVFECFPELVRRTEDGVKAVAYGNMTAVLLAAIKQQQTLIDDLQQRVDKLEGAQPKKKKGKA